MKMLLNSGSKGCPLSGKSAPKITYTNVNLLQKYISDTGKILPRRVTLVSAKKQRQLARAIKAARNMALLAYKID